LVVAPLLTGCEPPQPGEPPGEPDPPTQAVAVPPAPDPETATTAVQTRPPGRPTASGTEAEVPLRFVSYNLKNWLTMSRYSDGNKVPGRPKPDEEKQAVVATICSGDPDVVGVCEIGTPEDLAELRQRLADAGCDLPHVHHTGGEDDTRHLGLLSRFPIVATAEPADDDYQLRDRSFRIQRGILDATVQAGMRNYRILGVHFKSKREIEEADQAEMRRNEAHLLRAHIESIMADDPQLRLIVHGDMNDTRREAPLRAVQGAYNSPGFLTALRLTDSRGHYWTHHWNYQDIYSRFDYVLVNRALKGEVDIDASRILDPADWDEASDHRALLVVFR
jgi:endonuclease/exonuclease/phosphatase family metal-dependent hydrolase